MGNQVLELAGKGKGGAVHRVKASWVVHLQRQGWPETDKSHGDHKDSHRG